MEKFKDKRDFYGRLIMCIIVAFVVCVITYQHVQYISVAKSTVPIMDYWKWIHVFGEKVNDGTITFWDYFHSDAGEHIHPLDLTITFAVLNAADFDVVPLVIFGLVLRIGTAITLVAMFIWAFRKQEHGNYLLMGICAVAIAAGILNYNQWEAITQPFALSFNSRIVMYAVSFYLAERFAAGIPERSLKNNLIFAGVLGIYCGILTICEGGAYFVGHLTGMGSGLLWVMIAQRKNIKQYFWPMALWAAISFIAACVYYVLVSKRTGTADVTIEAIDIPRIIVEGVCYFWGALLIHPKTMEMYGSETCVIAGTAMLIYAIYITVRYLRLHRDGKGLMPAICVIYALILSTAITAGRVGRFGTETMSSSRYVVESSFAFFGIVWMSYGVYSKERVSKVAWIRPLLCVCLCLSLFGVAKEQENRIAPYRKIYNDNLYNMMLNVDDYSDDQLVVFQAYAEDVRYCITFFKENNLSIFADKQD